MTPPNLVISHGRLSSPGASILDWRGIQTGYHSSSNLSTYKLIRSQSRVLLCRNLITAKLFDRAANAMIISSIKAFRRIPKVMHKTPTVDNGKEFSKFKQLEEKTGYCIYFADLY